MATNPGLDVAGLEDKAREIRRWIIKITTEAGSGHPTSSLSACEVVTALYFGGFLSYDTAKIDCPDRDRFILSKGHAVPVQYAAMCVAGFYSEDDIMSLRKLGSPFEGHPNMKRLKGMEASTGSLGQGLSIGIGHALAAKTDAKDFHTYVLIGDGETGEGQVWEAFATAHKYGLGNLTAIIDQNGYQQTGATKDVLDLTPMADKVAPFGWHTQTIEGNDMGAVVAALKAARDVSDQPSCIVAQTKKGAGILDVLAAHGDDLNYHGKPLPEDIAAEALAALA